MTENRAKGKSIEPKWVNVSPANFLDAFIMGYHLPSMLTNRLISATSQSAHETKDNPKLGSEME